MKGISHSYTSGEAKKRPVNLRSAMAKATVLIVDDDQVIAGDFKDILFGFGYNVVATASSGAEAIRFAGEQRPDIVLMDIVLEGEMSGIEAANEIRSLYNTPVIFLTSYVDDDILRRAKITDPFGYLLKPCHPRELFATIELALSRHIDIMWREAMQEELRRSKEELAVILRGIAEGITVLDSGGHLVYANDAAVRMIGIGSVGSLLGLTMADILGRFDLKREDGSPLPMEEYPGQQVLKGDPHTTATIRLSGKGTGEDAWALVHSNPVRDPKGGVRLVITAFHDITERRRTEEHLQQEYAFRRAIEDSVPSGIATLNLDGVQTYVNQAFCRMVGWAEKELVGMSAPFKYWPPEETTSASIAFKRMLEGTIAEKGFELRFQHRNGNRFFVFVAVTPLRDPNGEIEGWLLSATDIDERKRARQQLEEAHRALERRVTERTFELANANEELRKGDLQLSTAQQIAHLGSWEWDLPSSMVDWSEEVCNIYGLQSGVSRGSFEEFLGFVHLEDREAVRSHLNDAVRTRTPFEFEERIVRPDGSTRTLQTQGRIVVDDSGEVVKITGVCLDITEQKNLREQLAEAERRRFADLRRYARSVQRAQEEERQRIARELHDDLCQQLSGMKMNVEVISDDVKAMDKALYRRLQNFNKQFEDMITDVRRMSANLRPTVLDDFGLIIALRLLTREVERLHNIHIDLAMDESTRLRLEAQLEIALYRIAQEALSNVVKHAQASHVTVALEESGQSVVLQVRDNGRGFNLGDAIARKEVHSGLGLISMRERTELLGGNFVLQSTPDEGTTIVVTIPLNIGMKNEEDPSAHR